jgi:hypothetical protein
MKLPSIHNGSRKVYVPDDRYFLAVFSASGGGHTSGLHSWWSQLSEVKTLRLAFSGCADHVGKTGQRWSLCTIFLLKASLWRTFFGV